MPKPISIEAIEESGAVITHDPLPIVAGDQVQLTQLFQNLLANAIKFRSAGGAPDSRLGPGPGRQTGC